MRGYRGKVMKNNVNLPIFTKTIDKMQKTWYHNKYRFKKSEERER